jgi:hypothetical protein
MRLTKQQADELAEKINGQRIFFMKCECCLCETETGAIMTDRNIRFYMEHVHAAVLCKTCAEEIQQMVLTLDMPHVVLHKEDEIDEKGHVVK